MLNSQNKEQSEKRKILIMGSGIIGLSTAYFLSNNPRNVVTVIDKDSPIVGASIQNAGTITLSSYSPWTTVNMWEILKENLLMYKNPSAYLRFTLIFDKDFRHWMVAYLRNRNQKSIENASTAILELGQYSIAQFDEVVNSITTDPNDVEYHSENFISTQKGMAEDEIIKSAKKYQRVDDYGAKFVNLKTKEASSSDVDS